MVETVAEVERMGRGVRVVFETRSLRSSCSESRPSRFTTPRDQGFEAWAWVFFGERHCPRTFGCCWAGLGLSVWAARRTQSLRPGPRWRRRPRGWVHEVLDVQHREQTTEEGACTEQPQPVSTAHGQRLSLDQHAQALDVAEGDLAGVDRPESVWRDGERGQRVQDVVGAGPVELAAHLDAAGRHVDQDAEAGGCSCWWWLDGRVSEHDVPLRLSATAGQLTAPHQHARRVGDL